MSEDGSPRRYKGPELDDMLGKGLTALLGASFMANHGSMFTAMTNTPGAGFDMTAMGGITRMMGGLTNMLTGLLPTLGQMSATSTVMNIADPSQQQRNNPNPTQNYAPRGPVNV